MDGKVGTPRLLIGAPKVHGTREGVIDVGTKSKYPLARAETNKYKAQLLTGILFDSAAGSGVHLSLVVNTSTLQIIGNVCETSRATPQV